jgi:hypothetical protein
MDIPESAREAGISAMHSLPEVYWAREGATAAVEGAAPHIARAAQVQILRLTADGLSINAGDPQVHNRNVGDGIAFAVHRLREMADELERS